MPAVRVAVYAILRRWWSNVRVWDALRCAGMLCAVLCCAVLCCTHVGSQQTHIIGTAHNLFYKKLNSYITI